MYIVEYNNVYKGWFLLFEMEFKAKFTKIGDSYYLIVPKSLINVFNLLKETYIYEVRIYKEGKIISYKRIGKEEQTKIEDFDKKKK